MSAWTKDQPTTAGLYWYRQAPTCESIIVHVFKSTFNPDKLYVGTYESWKYSHFPIKYWDGEWQPVTLPKD